jgi:hypothetical protein
MVLVVLVTNQFDCDTKVVLLWFEFGIASWLYLFL